jgi:hypothetical protein
VNCLLAVRPQASVAVAVAVPVASRGTVNDTENVPLGETVVALDPDIAPLTVTVTLLPGVNPWPLTMMLEAAATVAGGEVSVGEVVGQGLMVGVGEGGGGGGGVGDGGGGVGVGFGAVVGVEVGFDVGRGVGSGVDPGVGVVRGPVGFAVGEAPGLGEPDGVVLGPADGEGDASATPATTRSPASWWQVLSQQIFTT